MYTKSGESRCVDVATGKTLWRYVVPNAACAPQSATAAGLLVAVRPRRGADQTGEGYHILEPSTGAVRRRLSCEARSGVVPIEDLLLGADIAVEAVSAKDGATVWRREEPEQLGSVPYQFALGGDCVVYGRRNGDVVCVAARTGQERWQTTVRDLMWDGPADPKPGCVFGEIAILGDRAILNVSRHHLVCLSLKSGGRLWHHEGFVDQGCLVGHEYITAPRGVIDVRTGDHLRLPTPQKVFAEDARKLMIGAGTICATEKHVFHATWSGYIWAWERSTGDVVWCERPPGATGAFNSGQTFAICDGRLYYADANWTVYCYESGTDPAPEKVSPMGRLGKGKPARAKGKRGTESTGLPPRRAADGKTRKGAMKA